MSEINDDVMLTTYDNPYSPFTQYEAWWKYDKILGHETCETLAKESNVSDVASDEQNEQTIIDAMKRICEQNPMIYKIVRKTDYPLVV